MALTKVYIKHTDLEYLIRSYHSGRLLIMGICVSTKTQLTTQRHKDIEVQMKLDQSKPKNEQKILLLGTADSGKSTILNQMRIIHGNGFDDAEIERRKGVIYSNTKQSMRIILNAMKNFQISLDVQKHEVYANLMLNDEEQDDELPLTNEVAKALKYLWTDKGVRACSMRGSEYQLDGSASYFFDNIRRISKFDYKPSDQDMLRLRIKTTGISEESFYLQNIHFRVFDVGGQRSERKKWIHLFDDVNAVIFIAAMSEYDQILCEDPTTNRLVESMRVFESLCNSRWFLSTSIILFLNKEDLFHEKIRRVNITSAFPEYKGKQNYEEASAYIQEQYKARIENKTRELYTHITCATDTTQVQFVLSSTVHSIIQRGLMRSGIA